MSDHSHDGREAGTAHAVEKYLVCPRSRHALVVREGAISCASCGFKGRIQDNIAVMSDGNQFSFFDDKVKLMRRGILDRGANWRISFERQVALLQRYFEPGQVILDVGCGPHLPYERPPGAFVIGLEPSGPSILDNRQVDLGVCGTAANIPLYAHSVDLAIAFYSIHHMVGRTVRENDEIVAKAFSELGRVIKPGGCLLVFEIAPWKMFAFLQRLLWNQVRRLLGVKLDMYFRSVKSMLELGRVAFPDAVLEVIDFKYPLFATFPPALSLPWLRIPKLFYPLEMRAYKWRSPVLSAKTSAPTLEGTHV
ncbi:MAG: class I SAM-dependent methyltransferase [Elusimicrobiales bacterium]|jgi:SAM-dependent methyltransferase